MTHFVWYLEKEKRYDIETLLNDRVLNKGYFYGRILQKNMKQKLVLDPFLIMVNNLKNSHCTQETLLTIRYFENYLSKRF